MNLFGKNDDDKDDADGGIMNLVSLTIDLSTKETTQEAVETLFRATEQDKEIRPYLFAITASHLPTPDLFSSLEEAIDVCLEKEAVAEIEKVLGWG